ncbi:hypothetical protein [Paenibacillus lentus]|uniref:Uncharacterized protein n=1 Tax=Paenibacillus lentus TaxID=1338368 RepID=A0A3Q8S9V5_9BACL|nr:hypothetical protein [Paenibacillus lentus]AZK45692.1 hypothetical protein EIM92_05300 [Paenibacillus lentus]
MARDTKNKSIGWLKGVLSNQNEPVQAAKEGEEEPLELVGSTASNKEVPSPSESSSKKYILSKENLDKVSMDLVISLENMLNERQLILYKNNDYEQQLVTANETISRLKYDLVKKEQSIQDKNKEIRALETSLTNKQMGYDQLLEDYKEYQSTANHDFEKVSSQLEKEINKYNLLKEESADIQYQNMLNIRELEEKIRELEAENQKLEAQCAKVLAEKAELMQTINDFTERMSFSFSSKATNSE